MQATSGPNAQFVVLSTPAGRRGFFYENFHNDDPSWLRIRVPASECLRISQEFLDEEMKALGPTRFSEEYELQFVHALENAFSTHLIDNLTDLDLKALWS